MNTELLKETFGDIVEMYMKGCDIEGWGETEEDWEIDFEIFCDKFCVAKGVEVNEFLKSKILDEFEKRIAPFKDLEEKHRLWAIETLGKTFFDAAISWVRGDSLYASAQDYISELGLKQVRVYDEETEEDYTYIFDFEDAYFEPIFYVDCEELDLPQDVVKEAEASLCYY